MTIQIPKNLLISVGGLLLFALLAGAAYFWAPKEWRSANGTIAADEAAQKSVKYINENMLSGGIQASYKEAKEENGVYTFKLTVQGTDYDAYVTKNGKMFFAEGISLEKIKQDRPDVKVFVMSYCPYGLQAQKMYLPVYELLKNKADMGIYFVNYAMHEKKEIDENLRQYCIQKEQVDKFTGYLKCFTTVKTNKDGVAEFAPCLESAQIDKTKLEACIAATDKEFSVSVDYEDKANWSGGAYPRFRVNEDLNTKYSVQGSPTIIINGKSATLKERSPEKFKQAICDSFTVAPEECKTALSAEQPATGFDAGVSTTSDASAGCGS